MVKNLPTIWEAWVRSLGGEDPLEKEMATNSSILARRIPWTEEPDRLQCIGLQRVWHNQATHSLFTRQVASNIAVQSCFSLQKNHFLSSFHIYEYHHRMTLWNRNYILLIKERDTKSLNKMSRISQNRMLF